MFRPYRGKIDHLTLTWKVFDNVFANLAIEEKEKKSSATLGEILLIEGSEEQFEDLDEIAATVCYKLAQMACEITNHQYFERTVLFRHFSHLF